MSHSTDRAPRDNRRGAFLLGCLKAIDIAIGLAALAAGVVVFVATPPSVLREVSVPALVSLWGVFLIVGGIGSASGRLLGIWILETVGIIAGAFGLLIYLAVVIGSLRVDLYYGFTTGLALMALGTQIRRYVELQLLLSEPGEHGIIERLTAAVRLRTRRPATVTGAGL